MPDEVINLENLARKAEREAAGPCIHLNRRAQLLDLAERYREARNELLQALATPPPAPQPEPKPLTFWQRLTRSCAR